MFSTSKQDLSAFCCIWVKNDVRKHPEVELRAINVKGGAVSQGGMVWIAGARNLSVAVANWDWKFKNPAHHSFHTVKVLVSVLPQQQSIISRFLVIDSYESIRYQRRALPKRINDVKMFFWMYIFKITLTYWIITLLFLLCFSEKYPLSLQDFIIIYY